MTAAAATVSAPAWDCEVFLLGGDRPSLLDQLRRLAGRSDREPLSHLAHAVSTAPQPPGPRLALVAKSPADLVKRCQRAVDRLADPQTARIRDAAGVYFTERPRPGKVALLFPGEGAQYLNMVRDLLPHFAVVRDWFAFVEAEAERGDRAADSFTSLIYLSDGATPVQREAAEARLRRLDNAMLTVLVADWAYWLLLNELGVRPDMMAGHSMGELAALWAAGAVAVGPDFIFHSKTATGGLNEREGDGPEFTLLAVAAGRDAMQPLIDRAGGDIHIAMDNCPRQTVIVGPAGPMETLERLVRERNLMAERLPFGRPYHTPLFGPYLGPLETLFSHADFSTPNVPVYSGTTAEPFPADADGIRRLTVRHYAAPVLFTDTVRRMFADGARTFVEAGPRGNLSTFVADTLRGEDFLAAPADQMRRPGTTQLCHLAGQLHAQGVGVNADVLFRERGFAPRPAPRRPNGRSPVMRQYLSTMADFLDTQDAVMRQYLSRRGRPRVSAPLETPQVPRRPLIGEVVRHRPGSEVVMRRKLDLAEDLFALDHTVGGRGASRVNPDQNGLPVLPMTFDLEIMAELAEMLLPGKVVTALRDIKLMRWLPYDPDDPTSIEAVAQVKPGRGRESLVSVEIRDLGGGRRPATSKWVAVQGTVALADRHPTPPVPKPLTLSDGQPSRVPLEVLYKNLFHGPRLQGVTATERFGREGIVSKVKVLPRDELFASDRDPQFILDPMLMDVAMHPFASWHLEQPDQTGRILLPVELGSLELFGPCPAVGTAFADHGTIDKETSRNYTHGLELIGGDGRVWCRMTAAKYWRFYVPFGDVNFHGPKDEYFLSRPWGVADVPFLMKLDLRPDLLQEAIRRATACVTLTDRELAEFRSLDAPDKEQNEWLYSRIVAKDAVRTKWHTETGERLFPADIELTLDGRGRAEARHRGDDSGEVFATAAVAYHPKACVAACVGGVALLHSGETLPDGADATDVCARQAVSRAQGVPIGPAGPGVAVYDVREGVRVAADGPWHFAWVRDRPQ